MGVLSLSENSSRRRRKKEKEKEKQRIVAAVVFRIMGEESSSSWLIHSLSSIVVRDYPFTVVVWPFEGAAPCAIHSDLWQPHAVKDPEDRCVSDDLCANKHSVITPKAWE